MIMVGWLAVVVGLSALSAWLIAEDNLLLGVLVYMPAVALVWWTNGRVRRMTIQRRPPAE